MQFLRNDESIVAGLTRSKRPGPDVQQIDKFGRNTLEGQKLNLFETSKAFFFVDSFIEKIHATRNDAKSFVIKGKNVIYNRSTLNENCESKGKGYVVKKGVRFEDCDLGLFGRNCCEGKNAKCFDECGAIKCQIANENVEKVGEKNLEAKNKNKKQVRRAQGVEIRGMKCDPAVDDSSYIAFIAVAGGLLKAEPVYEGTKDNVTLCTNQNLYAFKTCEGGCCYARNKAGQSNQSQTQTYNNSEINQKTSSASYKADESRGILKDNQNEIQFRHDSSQISSINNIKQGKHDQGKFDNNAVHVSKCDKENNEKKRKS